MTTQGLLTVREVADELRLTTRTVQRLIDSGELTAVNVANSSTAKGKWYRISRADLDAFLEARKAVVA